MAFSVPAIHTWSAGDDMNAARMNEIKTSIDFLRNPPMVHVGRTLTTQAATVGTFTKTSFDTLYNSYDPYGMWNAGTPTALTCTIPGWYTIEAVMCLSNNATDTRIQMVFYKNTEIAMRWDQQGIQNLAGSINMRKESTIFLNVGDQVFLGAGYNTGAARTMNVDSTTECPQLRIRWVSN